VTSPVNLPAGSTIFASNLDSYENLTSAWQSYAPTWGSSGTAPSLGNGTLTGHYMQAGKLVMIRTVLTIGSTSTLGTGAWNVSLPVTPVVPTMLSCICIGSVTYMGMIRVFATSGDFMRSSTNNGTTVNISSAVPMAWAAGDQWIITGTYEAT